MNSYQSQLPRAAISLAAVAMTALTLGLSILPAQTSKEGGRQVPAVDVARADVPATEVGARDGTPIVVYGFRGQETGLRKVHAPHVGAPQKQQI